MGARNSRGLGERRRPPGSHQESYRGQATGWWPLMGNSQSSRGGGAGSPFDPEWLGAADGGDAGEAGEEGEEGGEGGEREAATDDTESAVDGNSRLPEDDSSESENE